jgi:thioesterase domain-containing protein/acyl carrier protein
MVPAIFTPRASLPRTASGKLDRRALPAPQFDRILNPRSYVAPRTPLEEFLTELWCEILQVEQLGIKDTFYDLGGSSIQGAILVSRLQEKLGHPIRLAALFEMPHIAALAHYLAKSYPEAVAGRFGAESLPDTVRSSQAGKNDRHGGSKAATAAPQPADVLVALQPEGDRPPLFMVHPPGGIVLCYQPMAQHFGRAQPLYGIRARGLHGEEQLPERLEEMAAEYMAAIRTVQPRGPYFLGGWSLGGVVTYEMAQQFLAQGEPVGLLALLDSTIPHGEANARYSSDRDRSGLEYGLDITLEELAKLDPDQQLPYLWNHARKLGVLEEDAPAEVVQQVLDDLKCIFHAHVRLATEYALRPYPGEITLFRPQDAPVDVPTPRDRGWGRLGRSVDVHFVPGQHHTMVKEPNIQVLAARLRDCISRAIDPEAAGIADA